MKTKNETKIRSESEKKELEREAIKSVLASMGDEFGPDRNDQDGEDDRDESEEEEMALVDWDDEEVPTANEYELRGEDTVMGGACGMRGGGCGGVEANDVAGDDGEDEGWEEWDRENLVMGADPEMPPGYPDNWQNLNWTCDNPAIPAWVEWIIYRVAGGELEIQICNGVYPPTGYGIEVPSGKRLPPEAFDDLCVEGQVIYDWTTDEAFMCDVGPGEPGVGPDGGAPADGEDCQDNGDGTFTCCYEDGTCCDYDEDGNELECYDSTTGAATVPRSPPRRAGALPPRPGTYVRPVPSHRIPTPYRPLAAPHRRPVIPPRIAVPRAPTFPPRRRGYIPTPKPGIFQTGTKPAAPTPRPISPRPRIAPPKKEVVSRQPKVKEPLILGDDGDMGFAPWLSMLTQRGQGDGDESMVDTLRKRVHQRLDTLAPLLQNLGVSDIISNLFGASQQAGMMGFAENVPNRILAKLSRLTGGGRGAPGVPGGTGLADMDALCALCTLCERGAYGDEQAERYAANVMGIDEDEDGLYAVDDEPTEYEQMKEVVRKAHEDGSPEAQRFLGKVKNEAARGTKRGKSYDRMARQAMANREVVKPTVPEAKAEITGLRCKAKGLLCVGTVYKEKRKRRFGKGICKPSNTEVICTSTWLN